MEELNIYEIDSERGDLVICDSLLDFPESSNIKTDTSIRNYLYLIADDDAFKFDLGLFTGNWSNEKLKNTYEQSGGYFGINVASGKISLQTSDNWKNKTSQHEANVLSGNYRASLFTKREFIYSEYRNELVELIGERDMKYYELVDKFGLYAWIPTILFLVSLFTTFGRQYWLLFFIAMIFLWLPYFVCQKTKRYIKIENTRTNHESKFPYYLIQLKLQSSEENISGGTKYI